MLKEEFEALTGEKITPEAYQTIETVYMYHPLFSSSETNMPKQRIANVYKAGGMPLISEMRPTALKFKALEEELNKARTAYLAAKQTMENMHELYMHGKE